MSHRPPGFEKAGRLNFFLNYEPWNRSMVNSVEVKKFQVRRLVYTGEYRVLKTWMDTIFVQYLPVMVLTSMI